MNADIEAFGSEIAGAITNSALARLPAPIIERLLVDAVPFDLPAGGTLYRDDERPRCVLVVSGLVRVYMSSAEGRQVTVRYARNGDLLGIAVIVGGPAAVSVQVLADTRLLMLSVETLTQLGKAHPEVSWLMAEELVRRLYDTLDRLAGNTFGTVRQRVARHLLDLAASTHHDRDLIARVTQQELADSVGSVRPVVARALAELRNEGLIASTSDGIVIPDPALLHDQTWRRDL